ncbi:hypothetical protein M409DRAFT_26955 [Zasmidium cellare ATCC 36951]|uniref:Uncharacterized protein n=1 Tax=Zasmidium cellare ATCC 36951 TaxID=1080233 RepID=A0A6A6C8Y7_ZASCE|nr:uncharacterized protein M409DRAFT_26955 [Zasmidium cellare ATCC 36951]KAF2162718.1 hypothetical protein M409DRAFT_26955 [Zasmidium cellare ATCC 36951]
MSQPRDLQEVMQTLPQEIFDHVYDLTFTAGTYERRIREPALGKIRWAYKFGKRTEPQERQYVEVDMTDFRPARPQIEDEDLGLFHVDRATRQKFAASFFGNGTFVFERGSLLRHFVNRLDPAFLGFLRDVRVPGSTMFGTDLMEGMALTPIVKRWRDFLLHEDWRSR